MRIVIVTPLYPPDIAEPAPYVKELARRLAAAQDNVTIVTYGHAPEKIPGVSIIAVNKQLPLLFRLIGYTMSLWKAARRADVIYLQNGASVELPTAFVSFVDRTPIIAHVADSAAHERAKRHSLLGRIERIAFARARTIITEHPPQRPEIVPFSPAPTEALAAYDTSWTEHVHLLREVFSK